MEQFEEESAAGGELTIKVQEQSSLMEPEDMQKLKERNEQEHAEFLNLIGMSKNLLVDLRDIEQANEANREAQQQ